MSKIMLPDEEKALFREAIKDVTPLNKKHLTSIAKIPKKKFTFRPQPIIAVESQNSIDLGADCFGEIKVDEKLFFARAGLQPQTIKKLRQGKLMSAASLDLHAMNISQAKTALKQFLLYCQNNNIRVTLIIHGKGASIIKNAVKHWLSNYQNTLAYCAATPKDGGDGAIYLLLKSFR